jgi:DNA-binding response OmpR family regulator
MATILLATEDAGLFDVLGAEITGDGHELLWATDGQTAYELTLAESPAMVLLDANLPVFNAFETCNLLRDDPDISQTLPIILLSVDRPDPHVMDSSRLTAHFPKAHLAQELRDLMAAHIGSLL